MFLVNCLVFNNKYTKIFSFFLMYDLFSYIELTSIINKIKICANPRYPRYPRSLNQLLPTSLKLLLAK